MKQKRNALITLIASAAPVLAQAKTVQAAALPRQDLAEPANHGGVYNYAFTPDGKQLAGASWVGGSSSNGSARVTFGGEVFLWDQRKGKLARTLGAHDESPIWLKFSDDGKTLASYSDKDHTLKLWKPKGRKPRAVIELGGRCTLNHRPAMSANAGVFLHISHRTLPIGEDGVEAGHSLTCWDLEDEELSWSITAEGESEGLDAVFAASPDGAKVAVFVRKVNWSLENGQKRGRFGDIYQAILDAKTGEELFRIDIVERAERMVRPFPSKYMGFTPDGEEVLCAGGTWLRRFSSATGELIGEEINLKSEESVHRVFLSEEGDRILVERFFGRQLDYYAFPSGEHQVSVLFESGTSFKGSAPTGDLTRIAGLMDFDSVILDLSEVLE